MSLYNMMFGKNPFSNVLMNLLGTKADDVPRFRDCYMTDAGEIAIHTRTGGGNRLFYESLANRQENHPDDSYDGPFNEDLRKLPGFLRDEDDDFDPTYATFYYQVPEAAKGIVELLRLMGATQEPAADKWAALLEKLRSGDASDPATRRALAVGEAVARELNKIFNKEG